MYGRKSHTVSLVHHISGSYPHQQGENWLWTLHLLGFGAMKDMHTSIIKNCADVLITDKIWIVIKNTTNCYDKFNVGSSIIIPTSRCVGFRLEYYILSLLDISGHFICCVFYPQNSMSWLIQNVIVKMSHCLSFPKFPIYFQSLIICNTEIDYSSYIGLISGCHWCNHAHSLM